MLYATSCETYRVKVACVVVVSNAILAQNELDIGDLLTQRMVMSCRRGTNSWRN